MPGAIIAFDQLQGVTMTYGTPGVARNDLWETSPVLCRCTTSGNTSYAWTFLDHPPGSAASLANADQQEANFAPDLPGSYSVQLTTSGGGPGNVMVLIAAVRYNAMGALVNRGWCLPALGEIAGQDNFNGNTRGWAPALDFIFADILAFIESGGGGGGVNPAVVINATGNIDIPSINTTYLVESSVSITSTLVGTPVDGLELTFLDGTLNWGLYPYFVAGQAGSVLVYPQSPDTSSATAYSNISGGSFTIRWDAGESTWYVKSVAFGYQPPLNQPPWFLGSTDCSAGGVVTSADAYGSASQITLTGTPSAPFIFLLGSAGGGTVVLIVNETGQTATVGASNYIAVPTVAVPAGESVLVYSDGEYVYSASALSLPDPVIYDTLTFTPTTVAPCTFNETEEAIIPFQTTASGGSFFLYNIPLPGTPAGGGNPPSPISSLPTPGTFTLKATIRLTDIATAQSAWWEFSWGATVASVGSPVLQGSTPTTILVSGTSASAPPAGWNATLALDPSSQYMQVQVTGDPVDTCNGSLELIYNNLQ